MGLLLREAFALPQLPDFQMDFPPNTMFHSPPVTLPDLGSLL